MIGLSLDLVTSSLTYNKIDVQPMEHPLMKINDLLSPGSSEMDLLIPDPKYWFQDVTATTPVTQEGQSIACWVSISGNKYVQPMSARRPVSTKFASGSWGILFNGTLLCLYSENNNLFSIDSRLNLMAGVHKNYISDDVSNYILFKGTTSTPGYFELAGRRRFLGGIGTALYSIGSRGTISYANAGASETSNPDLVAPHTATLSANINIVSGVNGGASLRVNKLEHLKTSVNAGDPALLSGVPIIIGASTINGGNPFNGIIGPISIRSGPIPSESIISQCEDIISRYLNNS